MERAWILFNYSVVAAIGTGITHMNKFVIEEYKADVKHHTLDPIKALIGWNFFDTINIAMWTRGGYDVSTGLAYSTTGDVQPMDDIEMTTATTTTNSVAPPVLPASPPANTVGSHGIDATSSSPFYTPDPILGGLNCTPKHCNCSPPPTTEDGVPHLEIIEDMTGDVCYGNG